MADNSDRKKLPASKKRQPRRRTKKIDLDRHCAKTGKRRYSSEAVALFEMDRINEEGTHLYAPLRSAYRCNHCLGWHLTTRAPRKD